MVEIKNRQNEKKKTKEKNKSPVIDRTDSDFFYEFYFIIAEEFLYHHICCHSSIIHIEREIDQDKPADRHHHR